MRNSQYRIALLAAACGTCAGVAHAQTGGVINISGATLLENFVSRPASTNDFIDVDGDGVAGSLGSFAIDQLAPYAPAGTSGQRWIVQYRATGSINGFNELVAFGRSFVTTNDSDPFGILGGVAGGSASTAYNNRTRYIQLGARTGDYNAGNPGGAPNRADTTTLLGTYAAPDTGSAGGVRIDLSPLDVPTTWAVRQLGAASFSRTPLLAGYGNNPVTSRNKQGGTSGAGLPSLLSDLGSAILVDPANPPVATAPNAGDYIFSTSLSFAPIAPVTSYGTGLSQIVMSDLRHLFVTGRTPDGVNFVAVTRDVGSGTRNAFNNTTGCDPSWGNGDNIGPLSTTASRNQLGADFQPSNKGSNGNVELTVRNHRLAIGYAGAERGVTGSSSSTAAGSWLLNNSFDILSVQNDLYGGTAFARPTIANVTNIGPNGWVIGGAAVLASFGDPKAESIATGGEGLATPRMPNVHAAAYLNNIRKSIDAFVSVPADPENFGMPGELAGLQFLLLNSMSSIPDALIPTQLNANPSLNAALKTYTEANNVLANPAFASFNAGNAGRVPTRASGPTYSDGVAGGLNYLSQGGGIVSYNSNLTLRNKIAGDFGGDGQRTPADVAPMIAAWRQRNGGPAWVAPNGSGALAGAPGTDAVIEILGDFDGDGSFTAGDVRYWADGLHVVNGALDRKAGFTDVDASFGGNFFGTTLATPKTYQPGDSRGDVSNNLRLHTVGFAPIGATGNGAAGVIAGRIDGFDIDWVYRQFKQNPHVADGSLDWGNTAEAAPALVGADILGDLSCDINGDLSINQDDVCELVTSILGTQMGDVDLDGNVTSSDLSIATTNLGNAGGWAQGDVDGDGIVTSADLSVINGATNPCGVVCVADVDDGTGSGTPDGGVTIDDLVYYLNVFDLGDIAADVDDGTATGTPDGGVTIDDLIYFLFRFDLGC